MVVVAVVGCGYWGSKHVRVLSGLPGVEVVAVDARLDRLGELRRAFPAVACASSLTEVIDRIDAAVVATPPSTHYALAAELISQGKHVLVEKPLATDVHEAASLVVLAEARGTVLMVGHTFEYNSAVHRLRSAIVDGELGQIHHIDTARLNLGLYQSDVNVVWDLAPHDVSILNHLLSAHPTSVRAWGSCHAHESLEDVAYLQLEYGTVGVTAQVHVSWLDPCKVRRVTVVGDRQMAVYNDLADDERLRIYDKGVESHGDGPLYAAPLTYRYGSILSPRIDFGEPLLAEDSDFVQALRGGIAPRADGKSGLAVVAVMAAAQESMRTGAAIDVTVPLGVADLTPEPRTLVLPSQRVAAVSR